jgi:hypothetical protein
MTLMLIKDVRGAHLPQHEVQRLVERKLALQCIGISTTGPPKQNAMSTTSSTLSDKEVRQSASKIHDPPSPPFFNPHPYLFPQAMADLKTAFCSQFGSNPCSLNFDIVPLYSNAGVDNRQFLGVVTIESGDNLDGYSYRVYPATSTPVNPFENFRDGRIAGGYLPGHPLLQSGFADEQSLVTEGTVTESNNMSFTFPIESLQHDYFVLVTPSAAAQEAAFKIISNLAIGKDEIKGAPISATRTPKKTVKPEFAIFYTSKVLKERKRRIKQRSTPIPVPPPRPQWFKTQHPTEQVEVSVDKAKPEPRLKLPKFPKFFVPQQSFHDSDECKMAQEWISDEIHRADELAQKLKAMEEGRRQDDLKRRPNLSARAFAKKLHYTDGMEFVPASPILHGNAAVSHKATENVASTMLEQKIEEKEIVSPWLYSSYGPDISRRIGGRSLPSSEKAKVVDTFKAFDTYEASRSEKEES